MIKYLGSKRRLVPVLGDFLARCGASTALDLFTGTTRVAQEWKRRGAEVWAIDTARYSAVLAGCYIAADSGQIDQRKIDDVLSHLEHLPGVDGYVTATFSQAARYFQPHNARRIDAIRDEIQRQWAGDPLEAVLLTSLLEAADRVDSTTGLQMAYLKQWAPRSYQRLALRPPILLPGPGHAVCGDATVVAPALAEVDLAYLDPPYNQHRYFTNYHVWETLVAWDAPDHYGVACKRLDAREPGTKSVFNDRRRAPDALARLIAGVRAATVVISGSNEGFVGLDDLVDMAAVRGHVEVLAFDSRRYVGAQIGIHNLKGEKVGHVSHTRNLEYLVCAGERREIQRLVDNDSNNYHRCGASPLQPAAPVGATPPIHLFAAGRPARLVANQPTRSVVTPAGAAAISLAGYVRRLDEFLAKVTALPAGATPERRRRLSDAARLLAEDIESVTRGSGGSTLIDLLEALATALIEEKSPAIQGAAARLRDALAEAAPPGDPEPAPAKPFWR